MATTVDGGFDELLARLPPSETETAAAKSHRESIRKALEAVYGPISFFRTGSFGHGTSIRGYSDVDYFAGLPYDRVPRSSNQALEDVRRILDARFPRTGVHTRAPAVVLPFGTEKEETTEVVPAVLQEYRGDLSVYRIPDRFDGWMLASPGLQGQQVIQEDQRLNNRLRPLIRFLKAWNFYNDAGLRSFYLESYATAFAKSEKLIVAKIDLLTIMNRLYYEDLAPLPDLLGGQRIEACSATDRPRALRATLEGRTHAALAREAEQKGDIRDAFSWWNRYFAGRFPAYG